MIYVLYLSIFTMIFGLFMLKRNNWVYNKRILFINIIYIVRTNFPETRDKIDWKNLFYSYDKMFFYFWCWDVGKMTVDRKMYDLILSYKEKTGLSDEGINNMASEMMNRYLETLPENHGN